jgi:diguanylate cyclase (GGDEF)-like protein/PAS domain S-box-containing protein
MADFHHIRNFINATTKRNFLFVAGLTFLYVILYITSAYFYSYPIHIISLAMVMLLSGFLGRQGSLISFLIIPLDYFLLAYIISICPTCKGNQNFWLYHGGFLGAGILVGFLADLREQLLNELAAHKETSQALAQAEELYRTVADFTHDWGYWLDSHDRLRYTSPSCAHLTGYTPDEFYNDTTLFNKIIIPEDRQEFENHQNNTRRHQSSSVIQFRIRHKDGSIRWIEHACQPVLTTTGDSLGFRASNRDITERISVEEKLQESEDRYRSLFEQANDAVFIFTLGRNVVNVNRQGVALLGYSLEELRGVDGIKFVDILQHKKVKEVVRILLRGGQVPPFERTFIHKQGHKVFTEISVSLIKHSLGNENYIQTIIRDISERKQLQKILVENEEKFRSIVENSGDGILLTDEAGIIIEWNPAQAQLSGISREEALGQPIFEIIRRVSMPGRISDKRAQQIQKSIQFLLRYGKGEWFNRRHEVDIHQVESGATFNTQIYAFSIPTKHGNQLGGITRDITEQKKIEEALRQNERTYRSILDSVHEAVYVQDKNGYFLDVNAGAEKMYGYNRERFLGNTPEFLSAERKNDLKQVKKLVELAFSGEPQKFEFWGRTKTGKIFPKEVHLYPGTYFDQDAVVAIAQDITKRKEAEKLVRQRTEDLTLLNTINQAINQGENLDKIMRVLSLEIQQIFSFDATALYLPEESGEILRMHHSTIQDEFSTQIEFLLGQPLPLIAIPIKSTKFFRKLFETDQSLLLKSSVDIEKYLLDFAKTTSITPLARKTLSPLVPKIAKMLNYQSTILIPLKANGRIIGVLNPSSKQVISENDLKRMENISKQVTIAIQRKIAEDALKQSEEKYRFAMETSPDSINFNRLSDGMYVSINQGFTEIMGYIEEEIIGKTSIELNIWENPKDRERLVTELKENGKVEELEARFRSKDGRIHFGLMSASIIDIEGVPHILSVTKDITQRKLAEEREREQHIFSDALRHVGMALSSTLSLDDVLDRMLENVQKVIPHDAASITLLEGDNLRIVRYHSAKHLSNTLNEQLVNRLFPLKNFSICNHAIKTGNPVIINNTRQDQDWVVLPETNWILSFLTIPLLVKGEVIGTLNLDSSKENSYSQEHVHRLQAFTLQASIAIENARLHEDMQRLATIDLLTNLYNRRGLFQTGIREVQRVQRFKRPLSILFADIDHFKKFNDSYGYETGDLVLQEIANCLLSNSRDVDIVGRYGGEEFIVLMPEIPLSEAAQVAERLRSIIEEKKFLSNGKEFHVTVSLGVTILNPELGKTDQLSGREEGRLSKAIEKGGHLLHKAKEKGRNRVEVDILV